MRRSNLRFRLHSLLLFTVGVAFALIAYRCWPLDGMMGVLLSGVGDDTVWAEGYSDEEWRTVQIGMKRNDVYALLGPPLEVRKNSTMFDFDTLRQYPGEIVECWTKTPENSSYSIRQIVFKGDDVVDKLNEYYID